MFGGFGVVKVVFGGGGAEGVRRGEVASLVRGSTSFVEVAEEGFETGNGAADHADALLEAV